MKRLTALLVGALALTTLAGLAGMLATAPAATASGAGGKHFVPADRQVRLTGHGYGHGIGMSQYGAEGAAREGRTWQQIVGFSYPGTQIGDAGGSIRVLVTADRTSDVKVSPAPGLQIRHLGHGAVQLPSRAGITRWRVNPNGWVQRYEDRSWRRWRHLDGTSEFSRPGGAPVGLWLPDGRGEVERHYRGRLRAVDGDTVNVLRLEDYLRGVVPREMPASWSSEALRAQSVAARTYAVRLRAQDPGNSYQVCDTTSCQVYAGADAEHPRSDAAIRATAGKVLRYDGAPALTMFSSSNGGWSADGGLPYLVAARDRWDGWSGNPVHTWRRTLTAASLESAYPSVGRLIAIDVVRRTGAGQWGGRVERLVLDGTRGDVTLAGTDLRFRFGLRSHWFTAADTGIGRTWRRLGGDASPVGATRGTEYRTHGGAGQVFARGRIYWSRPTGAHEVYGAILRRYLRLGGAGSTLGFPTTGEYAVPGGRAGDFQGGRVVWDRSSRTVTVQHNGWDRA